MLNINDYKEYKSKAIRIKEREHSPIQRTNYYLIKWGKFEKNITNLTTVEQTQAKILFATLKRMTADEREFLASKYRFIPELYRDSRPDREVAVMYGMKQRKYSELRKMVQYKFYVHLVEVEPEYKEPYILDTDTYRENQ